MLCEMRCDYITHLTPLVEQHACILNLKLKIHMDVILNFSSSPCNYTESIITIGNKVHYNTHKNKPLKESNWKWYVEQHSGVINMFRYTGDM